MYRIVMIMVILPTGTRAHGDHNGKDRRRVGRCQGYSRTAQVVTGGRAGQGIIGHLRTKPWSVRCPNPTPPSLGHPRLPTWVPCSTFEYPPWSFFFLPIFPKFWSFSPLPPSMPVAYLTGLAGGMEWNWGRSRKKEPQLTSYCNPIQPKNLGVEGDKGKKKKSPVAKTRDRRAFLRAYGGIRWPHRCRYQDYD